MTAYIHKKSNENLIEGRGRDLSGGTCSITNDWSKNFISSLGSWHLPRTQTTKSPVAVTCWPTYLCLDFHSVSQLLGIRKFTVVPWRLHLATGRPPKVTGKTTVQRYDSSTLQRTQRDQNVIQDRAVVCACPYFGMPCPRYVSLQHIFVVLPFSAPEGFTYQCVPRKLQHWQNSHHVWTIQSWTVSSTLQFIQSVRVVQ